MNDTERLLRIVIVGHVDHGKSTLVGRLLYDTGHLSQAKVDRIEESSKKRGMQTEWAFAMDALQAERDQAITIDAAQVWFNSDQRPYCIIDAPGHKEFLKNMVTGAASADAALLLIDANEGVQEQSRRHGYLLHLLGIQQIAVVVNKMDLVDYSQETFEAVEKEYREYLEKLGVTPRFFVPVCAREGHNIASRAKEMPWYDGPTVVEALDRFDSGTPDASLPLRLPLQGVYKFDERRLLAGRIESGSVKVGDRVLFSPCNKISTVETVERFPKNTTDNASAGESIAVTLNEQIFVQRGEVMSHIDDPPFETNVFDARVFWLGKGPLEIGRRVKLKMLTQEATCWIEKINALVDSQSLETKTDAVDAIQRNDVAEVTIRTKGPVSVDSSTDNPITGRFVLIDDHEVSGGGLADVSRFTQRRERSSEIKSGDITWSESKVERGQRETRNGHRGGVVWLTGLSGSGKSTLASELDRRLFLRGVHSYILDGDNVRHGLNRNLGFSPDDRAENIRRIGEVAKLFSDAGTLVITAFISPYRGDREQVRSLLGEGDFVEVFVSCPLEVCEQRDPKHLYQKARKGEIKGFTGIDAPYEAPENPELVVSTDLQDVDGCVEGMIDYLDKAGYLNL